MDPQDFTFRHEALQAIAANSRSGSMLHVLNKLLANANPTGLSVLHVQDVTKAERNRIYTGIGRLATEGIVHKVRNSVYILNPQLVLHPDFDATTLDNWKAANE